MPYRNKEDQKESNRNWKNRNKGNPTFIERCRRENKKCSSTPEARQKRREYRARPDVYAREQELRRQTHLTINGRHIRLLKRPRPTDDRCEVCGRVSGKLDWHHWNDEHPELGVWVCFPCHKMTECVDTGLAGVYVILKQSLDKVGVA